MCMCVDKPFPGEGHWPGLNVQVIVRAVCVCMTFSPACTVCVDKPFLGNWRWPGLDIQVIVRAVCVFMTFSPDCTV